MVVKMFNKNIEVSFQEVQLFMGNRNKADILNV